MIIVKYEIIYCVIENKMYTKIVHNFIINVLLWVELKVFDCNSWKSMENVHAGTYMVLGDYIDYEFKVENLSKFGWVVEWWSDMTRYIFSNNLMIFEK